MKKEKEQTPNTEKMTEDEIIKYIVEHYHIRKLTPKECLRLMGAEDWACERMMNIGHLSNSEIYHIAGDGLIAQIPELIAKELKGE